MSKDKKSNRFIDYFIKVGQFIYNIFLLQILWILYSIKGFILLGIFPATMSIANIYYKWFEGNKDINILEEFKETYTENFKVSNQVGYIYTVIFGILYIDIRVSIVFIQSVILHTILLLLVTLTISIFIYHFIVIVRYNFSIKNIFKQSFFVALSVPIYTIAAIIGILLVGSLMYNYIFLFLFFGIPLFLIPIIWFTYSGLKKAEEQREELDEK